MQHYMTAAYSGIPRSLATPLLAGLAITTGSQDHCFDDANGPRDCESENQ